MATKARRARDNRAYLFVGTVKGLFVYESDYVRETWKRTGPYLNGAEIKDIVYDYREGSRVYACTLRDGLACTSDFGRTWERVEKIAGTAGCHCLTLDPRKPAGTLYAGCAPATLAMSSDEGRTWQAVEGLAGALTEVSQDCSVHSIVAEAGSPERLFVAHSEGGILRSDDGGKSWSDVAGGLGEGDDRPAVFRLITNPARSDTLYASTSRGLYRTDSAGDAWQNVSSGLRTPLSPPIAVSPAKPATLYAVPAETGDGGAGFAPGAVEVFQSRDGGDTWEKFTEGLEAVQPTTVLAQALALDDLPEEGVYLGTSSGTVHISRDEGETWETLFGRTPCITAVEPVILLD